MSEDSPGAGRQGDAPGTALLKAARDGEVERVRDLIDGGVGLEHRSGDGATALIWAARSGHAHVVRELIARGASIDHQDNDGETALLMSALSGCVDAVRDLLDHGAAIDHQNRYGHTALYLSACYPAKLENPDGTTWTRHRGHDETVRELLSRGAETELREHHEFGGRQPVAAAAEMGNIGAVLDLLEAGAWFYSDEKFGVDLLNKLASQGDVSNLQQLLDRGGDSFDIEETDRDGRTPLACAIANRNHAVTMALLDRGAIVRDADRAMFGEWLQWLEAQAEDAYDKMSDAPSPMASGHYANAKDLLHDAIALARRLDRQDTVARLSARLTHIKAVFRSQF